MPAAVAIVGGALGIKPVIGLYESTVKLVGKGRGRPGALVRSSSSWTRWAALTPTIPCTVLYSDDKAVAAPVHHYLTQNLKLEGVRTLPDRCHHRHPCGAPCGGHCLCDQSHRLTILC